MGFRFFADHCVPNAIIQALRDAGHEVMRLREHLLIESSDAVVIAKAQQLDALLLSVNGDFSDIVTYSPENYQGIIEPRRIKMKIEYSKEADAIYVYFKEDFVEKSKEIEDGIVIDFDKNGQLIGIEVLDASKRFSLADIVNVNIENLPVEAIK